MNSVLTCTSPHGLFSSRPKVEGDITTTAPEVEVSASTTEIVEGVVSNEMEEEGVVALGSTLTSAEHEG